MTITGSAADGTYAEGAREYAPDVGTGTRSLSRQYDVLRSDADALDTEVREGHDEARQLDLGAGTHTKARSDEQTLLTELAEIRGMSWSHIAELAGVGVSAIRKWRKGGRATAEKRRELARIAAMLDLLDKQLRVDDPARWLEVELPVGPGYHIRPLDLYLRGHHAAMLDIAQDRKPVQEVLDETMPEWRQQESRFQVYTDVDGQRSIGLRDD